MAISTRVEHTPGPWKIGAHVHDPWTVYVEQSDGEEPGICTTDGSAFTPIDSEDEQIANARLIAAAPEMLAALKACLNMVNGDGQPPNWDWIREVVAKAEGQ